ncbi:MAG: AAA family ATPase [bacterium]|nr:AAA family ATPase [bacterium]
MTKEFNITGTCIPAKHYMANISAKVDQILDLVEKGYYFTINRPRQYGKTTMIFMVEQALKKRDDYLVIDTSFEGVGDALFENEKVFSKCFLELLARRLRFTDKESSGFFKEAAATVKNLNGLSAVITDFILEKEKKTVLLIDEVDKSSNNQLFLSFIGMLRNKYLDRNKGADYTFQSVILAGVHDIKTLKLKIRPNEEKKYNSPWNIAVDFKVDLSLFPHEIAPMLEEYSREQNVSMDIKAISERLFYHTSGYPFLVSKLCRMIDEDYLPGKDERTWDVLDPDKAVTALVEESNTNFDSLIINLENNPELHDLVLDIVIDSKEVSYTVHNPVINLGILYGIFGRSEENKIKIHNRVYAELIYSYLSSKIETSPSSNQMGVYNYRDNFIEEDGSLNFEKVLFKYREFMKKEYSVRDINFLEREYRLIFLAFMRPILNGRGYDFKEPQVGSEQRIDIVVTYEKWRYLIELKKWYGPAYHKKGLVQLANYLDLLNLDKGFLLIFDTRKESGQVGETATETVQGKEIFMMWI